MREEDEWGRVEAFTIKLPVLSPEDLQLLLAPFAELEDPRDARNTIHGLFEIIVMALMATLSGADGPYSIAEWSRLNSKWLASFLDITEPTPTGQTFNRVFAALNPDAFSAALFQLVQTLVQQARGKASAREEQEEVMTPHGVIAIDGKRLRRTFDRAKKQSALHLLSAFHTETGLVLGQQAVSSKTNEITKMPALLQPLDLQGKTVTIDAMGCQHAIAEQIIQQGGDYVLALKENQPALYDYTRKRFASADKRDFHSVRGQLLVHDRVCETDKGHGRIEVRHVDSLAPTDFFYREHPQWQSIRSLVRILSERTTREQATTETRYYISTFAPQDAAPIARAIRTHWQIENTLFWSLDTTFREDDSRARTGHTPQILAALRRACMGLLKADNTPRLPLKCKRMRAAWDASFLLHLLGFS